MADTAVRRLCRRRSAGPVKLAEQKSYTFHYPVTVRPEDLSEGGHHLGTDNIVLLLSRARAHVFHSMGLLESDLGDGATGIIIADLAVSFMAEGLVSDEIVVDTHFDAFTRKGFRIYQRIVRDGKVIALAETSVLILNYRTRRVVPIPEDFLKALRSHPEI